jgi:MFS family permease
MKRQRWTIAFLLGFGVLVNYFDRVNLSVSHDAICSEFGLSEVAFGFLAGAYNWTYAAMQLPSGILLDRLGVRLVSWIAILLWSAASFWASAARGLGGFFGARLLLGVGEAPTFPANAKAIGYWFPPNERSLPTSMFDSAAKFGSAIGVPLIGLLLLRVGWRMSFLMTGAVSLLYFLLFFLIYRDPEKPFATRDETPAVAAAGSGKVTLGYLFRQPKILGLVIGSGAYNYVFYLLVTWLPVYLSRTLHIDLRQSFLYSGVPWLVAGVADLLFGGLLVEWLIRRGFNQSRVRMTVLVLGTTMGLGLLGAAHAHTPAQALFWISVALGGLAAAAPVGWSLPSLLAPGDNVGKVGGIMNLANQAAGILAPIITGFFVASRFSFAGAFYFAAALLAIGIVAYVVLLRSVEPVALPD